MYKFVKKNFKGEGKHIHIYLRFRSKLVLNPKSFKMGKHTVT